MCTTTHRHYTITYLISIYYPIRHTFEIQMLRKGLYMSLPAVDEGWLSDHSWLPLLHPLHLWSKVTVCYLPKLLQTYITYKAKLFNLLFTILQYICEPTSLVKQLFHLLFSIFQNLREPTPLVPHFIIQHAELHLLFVVIWSSLVCSTTCDFYLKFILLLVKIRDITNSWKIYITYFASR